jgi:hypothetical protein
MVVRKLPKPLRIILGDLSDISRVLIGWDLRTAGQPSTNESKQE